MMDVELPHYRKGELHSASLTDFEKLAVEDCALFPIDTPCTIDNYRSWYINNPEFAMVYEDVGCCFVVPLNYTSWLQMKRHELGENDIRVEHLFNKDANSGEGIALHIYHIHKYSEDFGKGFTKQVLSDINGLIKNLNTRCIAFSGLCVSFDGIGMFERLGCQEDPAIPCAIHMLSKVVIEGSEKPVKVVMTLAEAKRLEPDYMIRNKCMFLAAIRQDQPDAMVWKFLQ